MNADGRYSACTPHARGKTDRRACHQSTHITVEEPDLIPMTEQERQAGITALSRLIAELLADEKFLAFAQKHANATAPTALTKDPAGGLPSGEESS